MELEKIINVLESQQNTIAELQATIAGQNATIKQLETKLSEHIGQQPEPYKKGDFKDFADRLKEQKLL